MLRLMWLPIGGFKKTEGGGPVTFKVVREVCVPFGDKSASDYAVLAKNKVVNRYKEDIPEDVRKVVTDGLVRDCYVDDGMAMPNDGEDVGMIKE